MSGWRVPLTDIAMPEEDIAAVLDCLRSGWLTMGPRTHAFEQALAAYVGSPHAVAVCSGTAALHLACRAAGLGPGDEVIAPALTFVASAAAARYVGAEPVLCDIRGYDGRGRYDFNIDVADAARRITPRTRALVAVHFGGCPADVLALRELCDARGLILIEDCAQAIGAYVDGAGVDRAEVDNAGIDGAEVDRAGVDNAEVDRAGVDNAEVDGAGVDGAEVDRAGVDNAEVDGAGRRVGTVGELSAFSFFSKKQLCVGEGGMVCTAAAELAARVRLLRSHALTSSTWDRHRGHDPAYDIVDIGYNFRLDEPRAALGLSRLPRLEQDLAVRRTLVRAYRERLAALPGLELVWDEHAVACSSHFFFPVLLPNREGRDRFRALLKEDGIQTTWYPALHTFTEYRDAHPAGSLPRAAEAADRHCALPLSATMDEQAVEIVVAAVRAALARIG
jgi:dTDP-4-amino-4,6-dideoxygalactose transaminase